MTVETVELNSRKELVNSVALVSGISRPTCRVWLSSQFASTSSPRGKESVDVGMRIGTGRDAEGESFRVSTTCACTSSVSPKNRGERVGEGD